MNRDRTNTDDADRIVRVEWTDAGQPSEGVVEALSAATDTDPLDTEPLQHYVDTESLDALVESSRDDHVRVTFTYDDLGVVVESSGAVDVFSEPLASE